MKAESRQIPQKLAARLKFVYCIIMEFLLNKERTEDALKNAELVCL